MELNTLLDGIERVSLKKLKPWPKNPRRGDVNTIMDSLTTNGQFRPLIVQKSTNLIIAGNHTYKAMQKLKWDEADVTYLDVDKRTAKKILLVDNRSQDAASYDYELLAEVIADVPDIAGTGYSETDKAMLVDSIQAATEDTQRTLEEIVHETPSFGIIDLPSPEAEALAGVQGEVGTSGMTAPDVDTDKDETIESLDDVSSELEGILELKQDIIFPIDNYWGIPELRRDMLLDKLPDPLDTWAGPDATEVKDDTHYIYNYGVDSARGLPWDRAILSFYTHDLHFENWWAIPAHYVAKVINAGLSMAITPNFSIFLDDPRVIQLWQVYRSRWMGRYMQEAGVKVIPDVAFPDKESATYAMEGIPKSPPIIAMQWQSVRPHEKETIKAGQEHTKIAVEHLTPETLLVYGSKTGHDAVRKLKLDCKVVYLMNRAGIRRGKVFDHKKGYDITKMGEDTSEEQVRRNRRETNAPHGYGTKLGRHDK